MWHSVYSYGNHVLLMKKHQMASLMLRCHVWLLINDSVFVQYASVDQSIPHATLCLFPFKSHHVWWFRFIFFAVHLDVIGVVHGTAFTFMSSVVSLSGATFLHQWWSDSNSADNSQFTRLGWTLSICVLMIKSMWHDVYS